MTTAYWKRTEHGAAHVAAELAAGSEHDFDACLDALNAGNYLREQCICLGEGMVRFDLDAKLREEREARGALLETIERRLLEDGLWTGGDTNVSRFSQPMHAAPFLLEIKGKAMGLDVVRVFVAKKPSGFKVCVQHETRGTRGTGKGDRLFKLDNCTNRDGRPVPAHANVKNIVAAVVAAQRKSIDGADAISQRQYEAQENRRKFGEAWDALNTELERPGATLNLEELAGNDYAVRTEHVQARISIREGGKPHSPRISITPRLGHAGQGSLEKVARIVRELDGKVAELLAALNG